ncbi:MAG TPA: DUF4203 domain-containing protein [Vicinamibacterales bacterium]|nr:DUF4203 domain-containing protein [Vicinamibacterales bacterium]
MSTPMLPAPYGILATLTLVVGGAVSCFAGYRLFRVVLAIYGFILGAMIASSMMSANSTAAMVLGALVGGLIGAAVLTLAYFVGIALVGAGLGALVAHVMWQSSGTGDPPALAVIVLAILGAVGAMLLQRYVIIVATAFGGAWTLLVGSLALVGDRRAARAAASGDVWILYPTTAPGQRWVPIAWVVIGLIGTAVQLGITGRERRQ